MRVVYEKALEKGSPIHIPEQVIHLFNLITLEIHKHKPNVNIGIQLQRIEFRYSVDCHSVPLIDLKEMPPQLYCKSTLTTTAYKRNKINKTSHNG